MKEKALRSSRFLAGGVGFFFVFHDTFHLREVDVGEGILKDTAGAEQDMRLLDEGFIEIFFLEGALGADAHAQGANVHQADDFTLLDGFGDYIFESHKHGVYVGLGYGTTSLDAFGHLADVDVAAGLYIAIILRVGFTVTRVDLRYNGVGYGSCHSFLSYGL